MVSLKVTSGETNHIQPHQINRNLSSKKTQSLRTSQQQLTNYGEKHQLPAVNLS